MKHVFARRLGVLTLGSALALGTLVAPAQADPTPAGTLATRWLSGELVDGLVPGQFGPSYGNSIDAAFSALASGDTATATTIRDAVAANINAYITGEAFGDAGSTYAGAAAKALVLAQRTGGNPRSFGGVDLLARVEAATQPSGRIQDTSSFGDYANTLGQAFAVQGLTTAGSPEAAAARSFLLLQQCGSGVFRTNLAPAAAAQQACTDASSPSASIDTTGLALETLAGSGNAPAAAAAARAASYLVGVQQADGSFISDAALTASNTNSTGLAATGLGAACLVGPAQRGAAWIRGLQVPAGATGALAGEDGAIAYDRAGYDDAAANGVPTDDAGREVFRRATVQAAPALIWDASAPASVSLTGPTGVTPGSTQVITVSGASAGETVCLTTPGGVTRLVGTGRPIAVTVTAPATGSATYAATTGPGSATFALSTAAPATPAAPAAKVQTKKVAAGDTVKVKVTGLTAGTKVVTKLRGTKVDTTRAKANGVAKVRFTLPKRLAKPGKATLKVKPAGSKPVRARITVTR